MGFESRHNLDGFIHEEDPKSTLPSVDFLALDFGWHLQSVRHITPRAEEAIKYAEEKYAGNLNVKEFIFPEWDIFSSLYIDAIKLMGARQLLNGNLAGEEPDKKKLPLNTRRTLIKRLEAKQDMQHKIKMLRGVYQPTASDGLIYEGLETIMYDAACLIINHDNLSDHSYGLARGELAGLLAEYKVAEAFRQNGYPVTLYGTPAEDMDDKHDIIVYMGRRHKHVTLPIQVRTTGQTLRIGPGDNDALLVEVPMYDTGSKFELDEANSAFLVSTAAAVGAYRSNGIIK